MKKDNEVDVIALAFEFKNGVNFHDQLMFDFFDGLLPRKPLYMEKISSHLIVVVFEMVENGRNIFNDGLMAQLASEYAKKGLSAGWTVGVAVGPALLVFDAAGGIVKVAGKTVFDAMARAGKGSGSIPQEVWNVLESDDLLCRKRSFDGILCRSFLWLRQLLGRKPK